MKKLTLLFCFVAILTSCENNPSLKNTAYIPPAPEYSQKNMWFTILDNDQSGVDVFYIPSTWEFDWFTKDSVVCHYADISNQQHLDNMSRQSQGPVRTGSGTDLDRLRDRVYQKKSGPYSLRS